MGLAAENTRRPRALHMRISVWHPVALFTFKMISKFDPEPHWCLFFFFFVTVVFLMHTYSNACPASLTLKRRRTDRRCSGCCCSVLHVCLHLLSSSFFTNAWRSWLHSADKEVPFKVSLLNWIVQTCQYFNAKQHECCIFIRSPPLSRPTTSASMWKRAGSAWVLYSFSG